MATFTAAAGTGDLLGADADLALCVRAATDEEYRAVIAYDDAARPGGDSQ